MDSPALGAPKDIPVQIVHIARDPLYESEKPYAADFSAPGKGSNHIFDPKDVIVKDARHQRNVFTLEKNGFCLLDCPTSATFESLSFDESAVLAYYQEMETFVMKQFPEYSRVVIMEHQVLFPLKIIWRLILNNVKDSKARYWLSRSSGRHRLPACKTGPP
jgi:hypothetical protein